MELPTTQEVIPAPVEVLVPSEQDTELAERFVASDGLRHVLEDRKTADYEYDPSLYVNHTPESAIALAEANGHSVRVVRRDGLYMDVHDGINPNRLKLTVRDGYVTAVRVG
jgi:hypothetical protein